MRRGLLVAAVCGFALAPAAHAATTVTAPVYDGNGRLVQTPLAPPAGTAQLTKDRVLAIVEHYPKVRDWLARYPRTNLVHEEDYEAKTRQWTVKIWRDPAGEIVQATVD